MDPEIAAFVINVVALIDFSITCMQQININKLIGSNVNYIFNWCQ